MLKKSFLYSLKRSIPILFGYFPAGFAFGLLMAQAGYNFLWSFFSSVFIFAGSLQMIMPSFLTEHMPLYSVAITALLLNSRHIFYGISFINKFKSYGKSRFYLIYGLTDENYSLLCSYKDEEGINEKWVNFFTTALIWSYWVGFSTLGGIAGQLIKFNTEGIDFAMSALFVVILIEQLKSAENKLPSLFAAISAVTWLICVGADNFLLPSLLTTVAVLVIYNGLEKKLPKKEAKNQ